MKTDGILVYQYQMAHGIISNYRCIIGLGLGAILGIVLPLQARAAYPSNTTYYIANSGSNANAGTSPSAPWRDFTNVNGFTFSQGDQILLKSGDAWTQSLAPLGNGVSGNPIILGSYGSGGYPEIYALDPTLVSAGKTVTTSSNSTGYSGSNALDDNTNTSWSASSASLPQWLKVDLGQSYPLSRIVTIFYGAAAWQYTIQGSTDDTNWTTLLDASANSTIIQNADDSASGTYRYIKITISGGNWAAIQEFRVHVPRSISEGQATSASSSSAGYASSSAVDGDPGTAWAASSGSFPQWLEIDLGQSTTFAKVATTFYNTEVWKYVLYGSNDGSTWATLVDNSSNTSLAQTFTDNTGGVYRYIKINVTGSDGGWASIRELGIFTPSVLGIVSQGKTTTTTSNSSGYPGSNSVDGNPNTAWAASSGAFPQYLEVDLGQSYPLSQITTTFYNNQLWKYVLYGSNDNINWATLFDNSSTGVTTQVETDNVSGTYRYVAIGITGSGGGWASISEFHVDTVGDVIRLTDPSYWTISSLKLTGGNAAVHCNFTQLGNQGLSFSNLIDPDYSESSTIVMDGFNKGTPDAISGYMDAQAVPSNQYIYSGVTISNVSCGKGGGLYFAADYPIPSGTGQLGGNPHAQQNIVVKNVFAKNSGSSHALVNAQDVIFMDCAFDHSANYGGTGFYITAVSNVVFNNSLYTNAEWGPSGYDNACFVYDNAETNVKWRGNYFRNNAASAIEGAENPDFHNQTSSTNSGFEISDNGFSMNSTHNSSNYYGDISVVLSPKTTGTLQNNMYYDVAQTYNAFGHGVTSTYWTISNNTSISSDANLYSAAYGFGDTQGQNQWSYLYWNGSSVVSLPTYSDGTWSNSANTFIAQFNMNGGNTIGYGAIREWTAPSTGTVNIVGWVLKNTTGNSAPVGIATNVWIWPNSNGWGAGGGSVGANDQVGQATTVNSVAVTQGQTITFWVGSTSSSNSGGTVSWAPMIGYH